jgi:hypothetical protein
VTVYRRGFAARACDKSAGDSHRKLPLARAMPREPVRDKKKRQDSAGPALGLIATGTVLVAALGFVGFVLWPRWPVALADVHAPALPITVGGVLFNVPPAAIRVPLQRHAGAQPRLDLAFLWPALTPPDPDWKPAVSDMPKAPDEIFLSLAAQQDALPLEERVKSIYPRYVEPGTFAGPQGLVGIAFRDDSPYRGEDIFFPPNHAELFFARCTRKVDPTMGSCMLERHVGQATLTARFRRDWLGDWQKLTAGLDRIVARLRGDVRAGATR